MRGSGPGSRVCSLSGCRRSWGEPATEEEAQRKETIRCAKQSGIHRLVPSFAWSSALVRCFVGASVKIRLDCTRVHGRVSIRNFRIVNVNLLRIRREFRSETRSDAVGTGAYGAFPKRKTTCGDADSLPGKLCSVQKNAMIWIHLWMPYLSFFEGEPMP